MSFDKWIKDFDAAITVCDVNGVILDMNEKAIATFEKYGGRTLIGQSLFDYHKPESVLEIKKMMESGSNNVYTIEKNGTKKLIYQNPWYEQGVIKGLVEFSIEIPFEMAHHVRN